MSRFGPALAAIVALGVVVRVLYTLLEAPWPPPGLDDQFFFSAAPKLLADGEGFVAPFRLAFEQVTAPTAEHPPLHSFVLAVPALVGLDSSDSQRLAGTLFGAGTITLVGLLGRRLAGDRAGLLAAGLAALYPVLVAADGALMSEGLYGLLVAACLLAAYRLLEAPTLGRAAMLGAAAGLAALTRTEALLLLPLVLLPVLRSDGGPRAAVLALVACALVLTPWTIRNWAAFDQPVLVSTNSGSAIGGANCRPTYFGEALGGWWPQCLPGRMNGNEAEHMADLRRAGTDYAQDHLGRLPVVLAVRTARVWSVYDPFQTPEGRSVRVQKLGTVAFWLLVPLGIAGAVVLRRRGVVTWILLAPFVVVTATALLTYGNVRFREPADVALVVLAAVALDALLRRRGAARAAPA